VIELWDQLTHLFASNQFLTGGALLGGATGLFMWIRGKFGPLKEYIKMKLILEVEVKDTDPAFNWLVRWFDQQSFMKKMNNLRFTVDSENSQFDSQSHAGKKKTPFLLSPGDGTQWFWYKKRLVVVKRGSVQREGSKRAEEFFKFYSRSKNKSTIVNLFNEAQDMFLNKSSDNIEMYVNGYDYWSSLGTRRKRPLETVIMDAGFKDDILADIEKFLGTEDWYIEKGIPYRRGYLISGPPGCGKSSLIAALASHYDFGLSIINFGMDVNDKNLVELMNLASKHSFIVLEDIDAAKLTHDREKEEASAGGNATSTTSLTLKGLLNAIDGLGSQEGRILIMTTNYPEKLDAALIRPGRCDRHFKLTYASDFQKREMFMRFYDDDDLADAFVKNTDGRTLSTAALQEMMIDQTALSVAQGDAV
jgi:chaperone BCS1